MGNRTEHSLRNFFIFNSKLGTKEGDEEKKILFFHPDNIALDTKINAIGFIEAIIQFTHNFTGDHSVQSVHTQRTSQLFFTPEPDFWMVMTLNVPSEGKTRDGIEYSEYFGEDIHDEVFRAVLRKSYGRFRMFNGIFESHFVGEGVEEKRLNLARVLNEFFAKHVEEICLPEASVLDIWTSVQYLPVNQQLFLKIQNLINMIEATFESIEDCVLFYDGQVVWSGISAKDLYILNDYMTSKVFPELSKTGLQGDLVNSFLSSHYGVFLNASKGTHGNAEPLNVLLEEGDASKSYNLFMYRAINIVICLFINKEAAILDDFFDDFHSLASSQIATLSSEINDYQNRPQSASDAKFLFFNELTLKHEGTIALDRKNPKAAIPTDVMNILVDLFEDRDRKNVNEEVVVKTHNDFWVVRKSSNSRHYFLIVNKTSSTLIDIAEESNRISEQHIKNIYFEK